MFTFALALLLVQTSFAQSFGRGGRRPFDPPPLITDDSPGAEDSDSGGDGVGLFPPGEGSGDGSDDSVPAPNPVRPKPPTSPVPPGATRPPANSPRPPAVSPVRTQLSCPLIDNAVYRQMLESISRLETALKVTPECQEEASVKDIRKHQEALSSAIGPIQAFWENPVVDPAALQQLDQTVAAAAGSLAAITRVLDSNAFVNSRCGADLLDAGDYVLALSDLIVSMAPFALVASINFSAGLTTGWVAGTVGLAVIAKALGRTFSQKSLEMNNPKHREVFLRAICEYKSVNTRITLIQLAQSGRIDNLEQKLQQTQLQSQTLERSWLEAVNGTEDDVRKYRVIRELSYRAQDRSQELVDLAGRVRGMSNPSSCEFARMYFQERPTDIMGDFLTGDGEATEPSIEFRSFLDRIEFKAYVSQMRRSKAQVLSPFRGEFPTAPEANSCKQGIDGYLSSAIRSLDLFQQEATRLLDTKSTRLIASDNRRIAEISDAFKESLIYERTLKSVIEIVDSLAEDGAAISRSEIHDRMASIREVLFESRFSFLGRGLVQSYIDHLFALHDHALSNFQRSFRQFQTDLINSSLEAHFRESPPPTRSTRPRPVDVQVIQDAESFEIFKSERFKVGTGAWVSACQGLESLWIQTLETLDHLAASQLFCSYISPMLSVSTPGAVVESCVGSLFPTDDEWQKRSRILERIDRVESSGMRKNQEAVARAMEVLECH